MRKYKDLPINPFWWTDEERKKYCLYELNKIKKEIKMDRQELKQMLKRTKYQTKKETGKNPTKAELGNALLAMAQLNQEKPKENWVGKEEAKSIKDILGK